jgi:exodeoxyribonuclease-3
MDEEGATFFHADYLDKIEQGNLFDAWRHFHKDKKEFTWFSNAGNGFRLDHFFVHKDLKEKVKRCDYIHRYREDKITDHSMMLLELAD